MMQTISTIGCFGLDVTCGICGTAKMVTKVDTKRTTMQMPKRGAMWGSLSKPRDNVQDKIMIEQTRGTMIEEIAKEINDLGSELQIIQYEIFNARMELFKEENKGKRIQDSIQQDLQIKMKRLAELTKKKGIAMERFKELSCTNKSRRPTLMRSQST